MKLTIELSANFGFAAKKQIEGFQKFINDYISGRKDQYFGTKNIRNSVVFDIGREGGKVEMFIVRVSDVGRYFSTYNLSNSELCELEAVVNQVIKEKKDDKDWAKSGIYKEVKRIHELLIEQIG